ncbi:hypothetical protein [Streptomyces sp. SID13031]|uniref:hypothetical protein n=1 Tax=Streptomyces sp. SID13031 TaxID=2706046 RepID=UPI0013CD2E8B|nr:hypothetical protein [Streptomyces sp. SID13031]NEA32384.1 hypothetical protein [Streptomyces sp. SID13031]
MDKLALLTSDQWATVAALGAAIQGIASALTVIIAVVAAKYAYNQVTQARTQVEEARKSRFDQAEQARAQEEAASKREFERRQEQEKREERRQEELARPFVVVDFEPSPAWGNAFNLVFENVGKTLAKNVRFTFDPALKSSQSGKPFDLADSEIIKNGIQAMPPGRRIEALFDLSHERFKTDLPMKYRVRVDSEDAAGRAQEPLEYVLDLGFRYSLGRIEVKNIHHVAKSMKEIESAVKKWTAHYNGLRVWVRDEDAYTAAEAKDFQDWKAQEELNDKIARAQAAGVPLSELDDFEREADSPEDPEPSQ